MTRKNLRLLILLTMVVACLLVGVVCAQAETQKAMFPFNGNVTITQGYGTGMYSHIPSGCRAIDVTLNTRAVAPFDMKLVFKTTSEAAGHGVVFQSVEKVALANGAEDYVLILLCHDKDISDIKSTYIQGEPFYDMGNAGISTDKHIHFECALGKWQFASDNVITDGWNSWNINVYPQTIMTHYSGAQIQQTAYLKNAIDPDQVFYLSDNTVISYYISEYENEPDVYDINFRDTHANHWKRVSYAPVQNFLSFSVSPANSGTVVVEVGDACLLPTGGTVDPGTVVKLTATPKANTNYQFLGWSSSNGGTFGNTSAAETTFTMPSCATTITATFGIPGASSTYTTTWYNHYINTTTPDAIHQDMSDTNPQVNGWVEYDVSRKVVEAGCFLSTNKSAVDGATRGNANGAYSMKDVVSGGLIYHMNSAQTAKLTHVAYTLQGTTANSMGFGMNSSNLPKPGQTVYYKFYSVLDNGEVKYSGSVQSFTMPGTPVVTTYALTASAGAGGTVNTGVNGNYEAGKVISITATPSSGYMFNGWISSNGGSFGSASSANTTFTMPAGAVTVTANFVKINCSASISPTSIDFGSIETNYSSAGSRTVTVTNNGNVTATLSTRSSAHYTLVLGNDTLVPSASTTVTITPKTGLAVGTYNETSWIDVTAACSDYIYGYSVKLFLSVTAPAVVEDGWTTTKPSGNYITKNQYRSRTKSTKTSSSSSLSGWTYYDTTVGAWGSWSAWSNTAVTASTDCEVETQTIPAKTKTTYSYSHWRGTNPWGTAGTAPCAYANWTNVTGPYTAGPFDTPLPYLGMYDIDDPGYGYYPGQNYYVWFNETTNTEIVTPAYTQYRYRTRTRTYHFYQWSGWSAWQDTAITANSTTEVEQRTLYRAQPNSVSLNYTSTSLNVGGSIALSATIAPSTVPDKGITWSSSNTAVATVSSNGTVTAVAAGQAVITAKTVNNLTAQCTITVKQPVTSISLSSSNVELFIDPTRPSAASTTLTATVLPANATNKVLSWYSDNSQIAAVDSKGCITAGKSGTTYVYALSDNGVSAKCQVTVKQYPAMLAISQSKIAFEFDAVDQSLKNPVQLNVTILPELTDYKTLTWHSADPAVATVDANGLVTPVAVGTTTVYATSQNGLQISCSVTVIQHATAVTVNRSEVNLCLSDETFGNKAQITAYIAPLNSTEKQVTWTSDNTSIATVNNGIITAKGVGKTTVRAVTNNGRSATVQVNVQAASVLALPSALKTIEAEAFMNMSALQMVRIPAGTTTIGANAFAGCQNLKAVYIPASVTSISTDAFTNCSKLCIYCPSGSTAEQYALTHRITFMLVD